MRAYRFHIATQRVSEDAAMRGRAATLCHKEIPEAYVFDGPIEGQPMCPDCISRWEDAPTNPTGIPML